MSQTSCVRETPTSSARTESPEKSSVRVLSVGVLGRHPLTRAGLSQLLSHGGHQVSVVEGPGQASGLASLDVVVYDLSGHVGAIPRDVFTPLTEGVPVVALTSHRRSPLTERVLAMGVAETVHLDITKEGLLQAVERAATGQTNTRVIRLRRHREAARADAGAEAGLTERELSILELVGTGLHNQDIADHLFVSINTVKTYIRSAYRKIGVTRRAEAVLWVVHHHLTPSFAGPDGPQTSTRETGT